MSIEITALWVAVAVALMLGTVYAIITPSKVDSFLGLNPKIAKGIAAFGTGCFLALLACKQIGMEIPGIELAAAAFIFAASGPPTLALIVAILPDHIVNRILNKEGKNHDRCN